MATYNQLLETGNIHESASDMKKLDKLRADMKKVQERMDSIEKDGGRIPMNDPLMGKFKELRTTIKSLKKKLGIK